MHLKQSSLAACLSVLERIPHNKKMSFRMISRFEQRNNARVWVSFENMCVLPSTNAALDPLRCRSSGEPIPVANSPPTWVSSCPQFCIFDQCYRITFIAYTWKESADRGTNQADEALKRLLGNKGGSDLAVTTRWDATQILFNNCKLKTTQNNFILFHLVYNYNTFVFHQTLKNVQLLSESTEHV